VVRLEGATLNSGGATLVKLNKPILRGCVLIACLASTTYLSAQSLQLPDTAIDHRPLASAVAELRSSLNVDSVPANSISGPAGAVFDRLVRELPSSSSSQSPQWELRITKGFTENAFSLPDGAVYVNKEMAQLLGNEPGLWAALLAHEIIHITEHHWMKRAAFLSSMKDSAQNTNITKLGFYATILSSSSHAAQQTEFAEFSRELELDADVGSLDLMARSGFHPDFVIALFHLMQTQENSRVAEKYLASHPVWDIRESKIRKKYAAAVVEFEQLWPWSNSSPGGNAPVLAFLGHPQAHKGADRATTEVSLPLRCENATTPVGVVLLYRRIETPNRPADEQTEKLQQTVTCTVAQANASFALPRTRSTGKVELEFYVMDSRGWLLGRSSPVEFHD